MGQVLHGSTTTTEAVRRAIQHSHPPVQNRFKKGRYGNPQGRPKGLWSGKDLLQKPLAVPLTVTENGVMRKLPHKDILFRSLVAKAIKGDSKFVAMVLKLIDIWKIDEGRSTVTRIERVVIEPDGTYFDFDRGRKVSIPDKRLKHTA